jgi:hypothetical protein
VKKRKRQAKVSPFPVPVLPEARQREIGAILSGAGVSLVLFRMMASAAGAGEVIAAGQVPELPKHLLPVYGQTVVWLRKAAAIEASHIAVALTRLSVDAKEAESWIAFEFACHQAGGRRWPMTSLRASLGMLHLFPKEADGKLKPQLGKIVRDVERYCKSIEFFRNEPQTPPVEH